MTNYLVNIRLSASWSTRPEGREACAARISGFLKKVLAYTNLLGPWRQANPIYNLEPENLSGLIVQNFTDIGHIVVEQLGWSGHFLIEMPDGVADTSVGCGQWGIARNCVIFRVPKSLQSNREIFYGVIRALVESFEPEDVAVFSSAGAGRVSHLKNPNPFIDWMIYLNNAQLFETELPGVFLKERLGSGTLVITTDGPLNLGKPDDLALIERIDPLIRQFVPKDLPRANMTHTAAQ